MKDKLIAVSFKIIPTAVNALPHFLLPCPYAALKVLLFDRSEYPGHTGLDVLYRLELSPLEEMFSPEIWWVERMIKLLRLACSSETRGTVCRRIVLVQHPGLLLSQAVPRVPHSSNQAVYAPVCRRAGWQSALLVQIYVACMDLHGQRRQWAWPWPWILTFELSLVWRSQESSIGGSAALFRSCIEKPDSSPVMTRLRNSGSPSISIVWQRLYSVW